MISFFLLYYEKGQFIPDFHYIFNRVRKISSTYSICDSVQLTVKPFAVLTRQISTCASTVYGFITVTKIMGVSCILLRMALKQDVLLS